jgi:hypothetical protein
MRLAPAEEAGKMSEYWQVGSECPIVHYSSSAFQEAHWGSISRPITRLGPATLVERALTDYSVSANRADRAIESIRVVHGDLVRVKVCWQRDSSALLPLEGWVPRAALRTIDSARPLQIEVREQGDNLLLVREFSDWEWTVPASAVEASGDGFVIPARLVHGWDMPDFGPWSPVPVRGVDGSLDESERKRSTGAGGQAGLAVQGSGCLIAVATVLVVAGSVLSHLQ